MRVWQLIFINQAISYGMFNDDQFAQIFSESERSDCTFIYLSDADMDLVHKLQSIYKEDSSRLRKVSKSAIYNTFVLYVTTHNVIINFIIHIEVNIQCYIAYHMSV